MRHLGSFRMYESVIREMAARGHEIHLALGRAEALGWNKALQTLLADCPAITWSWLSPNAATFWAELAKTIRLWADYLRYFDAEYASTPKLKARAEERVPPRLVRWSSNPLFADTVNRRRLIAALRTLERTLPPVPEIEQQLREQRPDVVLVTPLVYLGSSQFEVLRTALSLGLRTVFCVGSWDHLSSKALVRDMPHHVLVWNETQKQEAVRLHGVPASRVVVTGAQCYDQWFGRRPVRTREEFCRHVGLRADRPFVLYVCSALFRGSPVEAEFVVRWVRHLRASAQPELREAAVLIRPHPARMDEWNGVDLSPFPSVTLYGSNPVDAASKDDYFESLFYSSAIVGLNTSAFLEGAIVGRPVHTLLLPEFHENQEGTLHFHYLLSVGGGVLRAARSFDEHCAALADSIGTRHGQSTNPQFIHEFIRPGGLETPATRLFCDAVDDVLSAPVPDAETTPTRFVLLRWTLYPVFRLLRAIYGSDMFRDDWSRKEREHEERHAARARQRRERLRAADKRKQAKERERAATLAARAAAAEAVAAERQRAEAEKMRRKAARHREKTVHARRRRRADLRARLRHRAAGWLNRLRPGRQGQVT
jgi:hypothetical protein